MPRVSQTKEGEKATKRKIKEKTLLVRKSTPRKKNREISIPIHDKTKNEKLVKKDSSILLELNNTVGLKKKSKKITASKETVVLPNEIDKNLHEKVDLYKKYLIESTHKIFTYTAYTSGFIFIISGLFLCFSIINLNEEKSFYLTASLSCTKTQDCLISEKELSTSATNTEILEKKAITKDTAVISEKLNKPEVQFLSEIPSKVNDNFDIEIKSINTDYVKVFLESDFTKLELEENDGKYHVSTDKLKPALYKVRAIAKSLHDNSKYLFSGGSFSIENPEVSTTTSTTETVISENTVNESGLKLNKFDENNFLLEIGDITDTRYIEIYIRPKFSKTERFLGLARKYEEKWKFSFNGTQLPNGTYEIFIKYPQHNTTKTSDALTFSITNEQTDNYLSDDNIEKADPILILEKVKRDIKNAKFDIDEDGEEDDLDELLNKEVFYKKGILESSTTTTDNSTTSVNYSESQLEYENKLLLDKHAEKITQLLKVYATTLQGRDDKLIKIAEYEIEKFRNLIAIEVSTDLRTKDMSEKIMHNFDQEIKKLKDRVTKFEKLTSESSELISKDSDSDGISDFDEINLYGTNINDPDSDRDLVLDGIEIVKDFNPLNPQQEVVVQFFAPKELDYIDNKALVIESVNPIIESDSKQGGVLVLTEIKGKALPNSYATLFIFSIPTVVTIKTDENGDFVYVFEKELTDGQHEIYVTITGNEGEIVARSNPFKFTKTAEIFSLVDTENTEFIVSDTQAESVTLSPYNIVASMGVVSFGIILLMLGRTLKRAPEDQAVAQKDAIV